MQANIKSVKNFIKYIGEKCSTFFYGGYFPIYLALSVCLFYGLNLSILGLLVFSIAGSIVFLCYKDCTPILPILFMVVLNFRDYAVMNGVWGYLALLPVMVSFVAHFFLYPIKKIKTGKLVRPFIVLTVAYVLSGAFVSGYHVLEGLAPILALGPVLLVVYLFFTNTINPPKGFDIKKYLCYCFAITGLTMIAQIGIVRTLFPDMIPELGWANINAAAAFITLAVASCYYLLIKAERTLPFILLLCVFYASFAIISSDAVVGLIIFFSPLMLLYTYRNIKHEHKKKILILFFIFVFVAIALFSIILYLKGYKYIFAEFEVSFSDNGRLPLYKESLYLFAKYPIFGAGAGYTNYDTELITNGIRIYNFHSTFFHVIATMGIIGFFAYLYYFIERFKILMAKYNAFTFFMLTAFIMFECYGMVDTCEFNAIPLMCAVTAMLVVVEITNKGNDCSPLPLTYNRKYGRFTKF